MRLAGADGSWMLTQNWRVPATQPASQHAHHTPMTPVADLWIVASHISRTTPRGFQRFAIGE